MSMGGYGDAVGISRTIRGQKAPKDVYHSYQNARIEIQLERDGWLIIIASLYDSDVLRSRDNGALGG
jgi:hypothetical protein